MAIDFPTNPSDNDEYNYAGTVFVYTETGATGYWRVGSVPLDPAYALATDLDNSDNWDTAYGWGDHAGLYA